MTSSAPHKLSAFQQIKLLADPRRLEILRRLMATPATLSQLGQTLGQSPAWVRHHIQQLEQNHLIKIDEIRVTGSVTEKYYRAAAPAFFIQELLLPESPEPLIILSGSHDLALELIAEQALPNFHILSLPVGSLDGLISLRQGLCHLAGSHLLDASGEYNSPHVRHIFPEQDVQLITLAHRTQGLMLAPNNPKQIRNIQDLAQPNVTFINRNAGSGTRLWLELELKRQGLAASLIKGFENGVKTHRESALAVESGQADAALGIQAAAEQSGLAFIPLFEERYDLVIPQSQVEKISPLLTYLQTAAFRHQVKHLAGYATGHSGEQIYF